MARCHFEAFNNRRGAGTCHSDQVLAVTTIAVSQRDHPVVVVTEDLNH